MCRAVQNAIYSCTNVNIAHTQRCSPGIPYWRERGLDWALTIR